MVPPGRVLDLIEAIEISAEKFDYQFTLSQQVLITKLRRKATQGLQVSDDRWESLCDLFNLVEGRFREFDEESTSSTRAVVFYVIFPSLALIFGLSIFGIYLLLGAIK